MERRRRRRRKPILDVERDTAILKWWWWYGIERKEDHIDTPEAEAAALFGDKLCKLRICKSDAFSV